jgi:superfamily II DNA or RNA helicase
MEGLVTLVLRDYQQNLLDRLYDLFKQGKRVVMCQLPTGGGKSKLFSQLAIDARKEFAKRVLIIAHTEELVLQNAAHLESYLPGQVGIIKAGQPKSYWSPVQSASAQTLVNRFDVVGDFDIVIIDEAHHSSSDSYRKIIAQYPNAQIVGLTATPIRTDGKGFEDIYEELICGISTAELIEQGHLSRYVLKADKRPMTKSTRLIGGDYNLKDLADLNDSIELAGDLVKSYQEYANGGSCITFAINVEHSQSIAAAYNAAGIPALHLDCKPPTGMSGKEFKKVRKEALSKLASGELKVICNVGLFGEGVDVPTLDCVQIARPTKSIGLWLQMVGRVLRVAKGKLYGLLLDHTDNYAMLGLPDDDWEWKLEGKPKKEPVVNEAKERKEAAQVERKVIKELKELGLVRIASRADGAQYWDDLLERTKYQQHSTGKKAMWVMHRMQAKYPPLRIWLAIAEYVSKSEQWGNAKYEEQTKLAAIDGLRAASRATDGLRAIKAVRLRWEPEVLQAASRLIATEQRDRIKELVEADNARKNKVAA